MSTFSCGAPVGFGCDCLDIFKSRRDDLHIPIDNAASRARYDHFTYDVHVVALVNVLDVFVERRRTPIHD